MSLRTSLLLFTLVLAICQPTLAQTYAYEESVGTSDPFDYTTTGTTVLSIPSEDVLSSAQTLPFSWSFYGVAKSTYYVSDNGYITFDSTPASSDPNNTAVPNAGGPNDAIYAFWDDLGIVSGSGSADKVETWTYCEAPRRVHVIQWYSVTPISGSGFIYAAIRLYECGDFDIVLNYGNATGLTGTIGCENSVGSVGTQVTGSPTIPYPFTGSGPADDVVYTFYWGGIQYDMAMTSLDFGEVVSLGDQTVSGTVTNQGSVVVTGFDLVYQVDNEPPQVDTLSGLFIDAFGGTYDFTHSTLWSVVSGGSTHNVRVWAENINVSHADQRTCNDALTASVLAANDTWGFKRVMLEVFTGAWCGWCPDGAVVRDQILADYGPRVMAVDIHDTDGMEFAEGIRSEFGVSSYPNGMVDRTVFDGEADEPHSRGEWPTNVETQLSAYTPLNVGVTSSYNSNTRQVQVTLEAEFTDYANGDLRFVCMVIEDTVVGSGSGYDQTNYFDTTPGHPYEGAGDPIVGFNHRYVLRDISSALGNPSVISTPVEPGETATESFSFTLPAGVDENDVSVVGFVARYGVSVGEKAILNVQKAPLGETREVPLFASTFNSGWTGDWSAVGP